MSGETGGSNLVNLAPGDISSHFRALRLAPGDVSSHFRALCRGALLGRIAAANLLRWLERSHLILELISH